MTDMNDMNLPIVVETIQVELMEAFTFKLPEWQLEGEDVRVCVEYYQLEETPEMTCYRVWASLNGMNLRGLVFAGEVPYRKKTQKQTDLILEQLSLNAAFIEAVEAFVEMVEKFSKLFRSWQKE